MDKLIPASKIPAALSLLLAALLALGGASSPAHLEPPFLYVSPDEWSFENKPVARIDELPSNVLDDAVNGLDETGAQDPCPIIVGHRYTYYQKAYPRFSLIADDPRAFQLFLHNAAERIRDDADGCLPSMLIDRIIDSGSDRCNFNVGKEYDDPVLRDDIDKVIELVEARHEVMVLQFSWNSTLIRSNEWLDDTKLYLMELGMKPDSYTFPRDLLLEAVFERDPDRYNFIVEAAKRNDFRAVLRTNPPCRPDPPQEKVAP
ncbi:MAG: hypothetical protein HRU27_06220 [Rhizobiaceae bacterium]|nr:hypothetical protein [Hyphomicrobiales bacterium]NRB30174.1 hypothetical protein [Rhizobiaceae bacterium]